MVRPRSSGFPCPSHRSPNGPLRATRSPGSRAHSTISKSCTDRLAPCSTVTQTLCNLPVAPPAHDKTLPQPSQHLEPRTASPSPIKFVDRSANHIGNLGYISTYLIVFHCKHGIIHMFPTKLSIESACLCACEHTCVEQSCLRRFASYH